MAEEEAKQHGRSQSFQDKTDMIDNLPDSFGIEEDDISLSGDDDTRGMNPDNDNEPTPPPEQIDSGSNSNGKKENESKSNDKSSDNLAAPPAYDVGPQAMRESQIHKAMGTATGGSLLTPAQIASESIKAEGKTAKDEFQDLASLFHSSQAQSSDLQNEDLSAVKDEIKMTDLNKVDSIVNVEKDETPPAYDPSNPKDAIKEAAAMEQTLLMAQKAKGNHVLLPSEGNNLMSGSEEEQKEFLKEKEKQRVKAQEMANAKRAKEEREKEMREMKESKENDNNEKEKNVKIQINDGKKHESQPTSEINRDEYGKLPELSEMNGAIDDIALPPSDDEDDLANGARLKNNASNRNGVAALDIIPPPSGASDASIISNEEEKLYGIKVDSIDDGIDDSIDASIDASKGRQASATVIIKSDSLVDEEKENNDKSQKMEEKEKEKEKENVMPNDIEQEMQREIENAKKLEKEKEKEKEKENENEMKDKNEESVPKHHVIETYGRGLNSVSQMMAKTKNDNENENENKNDELTKILQPHAEKSKQDNELASILAPHAEKERKGKEIRNFFKTETESGQSGQSGLPKINDTGGLPKVGGLPMPQYDDESTMEDKDIVTDLLESHHGRIETHGQGLMSMTKQIVNKQDEFQNAVKQQKEKDKEKEKGKGKGGKIFRSSFLGKSKTKLKDNNTSNKKQNESNEKEEIKRRKFKAVELPTREKLIKKIWNEAKPKDIENTICSIFSTQSDNVTQAKAEEELIDCVVNDLLPKLKNNPSFQNTFMYGICPRISQMSEFDLNKQKEWLSMTCDMMANEMHVHLSLFNENDLSNYGFDKFPNPKNRGRKLDILQTLKDVGYELDLSLI